MMEVIVGLFVRNDGTSSTTGVVSFEPTNYPSECSGILGFSPRTLG